MKNNQQYPFEAWRRDLAKRFPVPSASSELAPSETAGPVRVVAAVATGSNPVSPEEFLLKLVDDTRARIAIYRREQDQCRKANLPSQAGWAEGYADAEEKHLFMLEALCNQMGLPKPRQPESNHS